MTINIPKETLKDRRSLGCAPLEVSTELQAQIDIIFQTHLPAAVPPPLQVPDLSTSRGCLSTLFGFLIPRAKKRPAQ